MIEITATGDTTLYTAGKYCAEDILIKVPEGGIDLPELINQATASELFLNKELIDSNGNKVTGTFTIDSELSEQDDLIAQIASALEGKAGGGDSSNIETCTVTINSSGGAKIHGYATTIFENNQIYSNMSDLMSTTSCTISNVVKGSVLIIKSNALIMPSYNVSDSGIVMWYILTNYGTGGYWVFSITPTSSDNITINIREDD